jgi:hypothetical protein
MTMIRTIVTVVILPGVAAGLSMAQWGTGAGKVTAPGPAECQLRSRSSADSQHMRMSDTRLCERDNRCLLRIVRPAEEGEVHMPCER